MTTETTRKIAKHLRLDDIDDFYEAVRDDQARAMRNVDGAGAVEAAAFARDALDSVHRRAVRAIQDDCADAAAST